MQPHSPLYPSFVDPYPSFCTPTPVHVPHPDYFLYPHLLVSGNWLIHLFFCDKFEFSRQVPITGEPTRRRTAFGPPLTHFWDNANFVLSRQDLLTEEKKKEKKAQDRPSLGGCVRTIKQIRKMGKIQRSFIDQPVLTRIQQCEILQNVYTTRKPWLKTKTNQYCHPFHGEKGHTKKWQFQWHYIYNNRNPPFWTSTTMT